MTNCNCIFNSNSNLNPSAILITIPFLIPNPNRISISVQFQYQFQLQFQIKRRKMNLLKPYERVWWMELLVSSPKIIKMKANNWSLAFPTVSFFLSIAQVWPSVAENRGIQAFLVCAMVPRLSGTHWPTFLQVRYLIELNLPRSRSLSNHGDIA